MDLPSNDLNKTQEKGMKILFNLFGKIDDLGVVYDALGLLSKHDIMLRGLLVMAIKKRISGRELGRSLDIPNTTMHRRLKAWMQRGLVEKVDDGRPAYKIASPELASGLIQIAKHLDFLFSP